MSAEVHQGEGDLYKEHSTFESLLATIDANEKKIPNSLTLPPPVQGIVPRGRTVAPTPVCVNINGFRLNEDPAKGVIYVCVEPDKGAAHEGCISLEKKIDALMEVMESPDYALHKVNNTLVVAVKLNETLPRETWFNVFLHLATTDHMMTPEQAVQIKTVVTAGQQPSQLSIPSGS